MKVNIVIIFLVLLLVGLFLGVEVGIVTSSLAGILAFLTSIPLGILACYSSHRIWRARFRSSSVDEGVGEKLHPGGQCIP